VKSCPQTKLAEDDLLQLHSADDNVAIWLRDVVIKALVKQIQYVYNDDV